MCLVMALSTWNFGAASDGLSESFGATFFDILGTFSWVHAFCRILLLIIYFSGLSIPANPSGAYDCLCHGWSCRGLRGPLWPSFLSKWRGMVTRADLFLGQLGVLLRGSVHPSPWVLCVHARSNVAHDNSHNRLQYTDTSLVT